MERYGASTTDFMLGVANKPGGTAGPVEVSSLAQAVWTSVRLVLLTLSNPPKLYRILRECRS